MKNDAVAAAFAAAAAAAVSVGADELLSCAMAGAAFLVLLPLGVRGVSCCFWSGCVAAASFAAPAAAAAAAAAA